MESEDKRIVECPHCHARYVMPASQGGRLVNCKACLKSFQASLEHEDDQGEASGRRPTSSRDDNGVSAELAAQTFGKLAVKYRFITAEQLAEALERTGRQKTGDRRKFLREYLLSQGIVSSKQMKILESIQEMREIRTLDRSFGDIAVKNGWVSRENIEAALKDQERLFLEAKQKKLLGDILLDRGLISGEQRDAILARQNRMTPGKAGSELDADPDDDHQEIDPMELGFEITISADRLEAFIHKVGDPPPGVAAKNLRSLMDKYGIVYGFVDDKSLRDYLGDETLQEQPWKIAQGTPPREGKAPSLKYYFDTDPHRIAAARDGELPDFKDRGVVPQMKKGDVIAEKIPGLEGAPGMNIFGETISKPPARTIKLQAGPGAERTEDGLKILARIDGRPEIGSDGRISILPYFEIAGDVGYETGNVIFEGHVEVKGAIKDEFWVKSGSLGAKEILKAEVDIQGDVNVQGGIIGGRIKCGGNLRAKYIQAAVVQVEGDLLVETELRFSKVAVGGACIVNRGKILGSWVSANRYIEARQVGSDASEGSVLTIGVDRKIQKTIEKIKTDIAAKRKEQERLRANILILEEKTGRFNRRIGEINEVWERAMARKVEQGGKTGKDSAPDQDAVNFEKTLRYIDSILNQCQVDLGKLADEHEAIIEKIIGSREGIERAEQEIHNMDEEIERLVEESKTDNFVPFVRVSGSILANTKVRGRHSSLILDKDCRQVIIKEARTGAPDGKVQWDLKMSNM
ncbi:MAG: FapA family protein [Pseudomonadota bacterium]